MLNTAELLLLKARKAVRDTGLIPVDLELELQSAGFNPDFVTELVLTAGVERPLEEAYHRAFTNPDLDSKRILSLVQGAEVDTDLSHINGGYGLHTYATF